MMNIVSSPGALGSVVFDADDVDEPVELEPEPEPESDARVPADVVVPVLPATDDISAYGSQPTSRPAARHQRARGVTFSRYHGLDGRFARLDRRAPWRTLAARRATNVVMTTTLQRDGLGEWNGASTGVDAKARTPRPSCPQPLILR